MPFNPRHGAYPANGMTVYPPHRGGPHSLHPGPNVRRRPSLCYIHLLDLYIKTPVTYKPDIRRRSSADSHALQNYLQRMLAWHSRMIQSLSAYAKQSNWQAAMLPQQSPPLSVGGLSSKVKITCSSTVSMVLEDLCWAFQRSSHYLLP